MADAYGIGPRGRPVAAQSRGLFAWNKVKNRPTARRVFASRCLLYTMPA